jgi:hypothetical protein
MQLFQGMSIDGQPEKLRRLPDEIEKRLTGGWSRNRPRESKMNKSSLSSELYCFHCEEAPDREAVDVWLSRDSNQLRVSNIVPSDVSELSYAQYNAILKEFAEQFALAAAQSLGLRVEITRPDVTVEDVLPPDLVRALVDFSTHANKGSARIASPRQGQVAKVLNRCPSGTFGARIRHLERLARSTRLAQRRRERVG